MARVAGRSVRVILVSVALGAAGACSSTGSGGGSGNNTGGSGGSGGGSTIDDFIEVYCSLARTCCAAAGLPAEPLADCEPEVERQVDLVTAVRQGRTKLLEPAFSECLEGFRSLMATCDAAGVGVACGQVYDGTVAEGGACTDSVECSSDAKPVACLIVRTANAGVGTCRALARGAPGDACLVSADGSRRYGVTYSTDAPEPPAVYCDSRDGLHCSLTRNVCEPFHLEGQPCDFRECAPGLYCDATCQRVKAEGESCAGADECGEGIGCVDGVCGPIPIAGTEICEGDYN